VALWVTVDSVKALMTRIGLDITTWTDADVEYLIELAQATFEHKCQREFEYRENEQIEIDGSGTPALVLPGFPIAALNAITILTSPNIPSQSITTGDVVVDDTRGILFFNRQSMFSYTWYPTSGMVGYNTWPIGNRNIRVNYNFGYHPGPSPANNFPITLLDAIRKMAALQAIVQSPSEAQKRDLTRIKIMDYMEEFGKKGIYEQTIKSWEDTIAEVVLDFKRVFMGTP